MRWKRRMEKQWGSKEEMRRSLSIGQHTALPTTIAHIQGDRNAFHYNPLLEQNHIHFSLGVPTEATVWVCCGPVRCVKHALACTGEGWVGGVH